MKKAEVIPDQLDAMDALRICSTPRSRWRWSTTNTAISKGWSPRPTCLTAIVGNFASHQDEGDEPMIVERDDGSLLDLRGVAGRRARRTGSRSSFPKTATTRPRPAMCFRCSSVCPRKASTSPSRAGASRSSTWTGARSTSCWSPPLRKTKMLFGLRKADKLPLEQALAFSPAGHSTLQATARHTRTRHGFLDLSFLHGGRASPAEE